jgi:glycosyltransferase involved in cell wall biosynthesis
MNNSVIPAVAPHPNGTPFLWSVMIPCHNPRPDYLAETLRSVLRQNPGPGLMQIMVVDDASPNGPPTDLVKQVAGDRISVRGLEKNLGMAGTWNYCIQCAQGRWVHILHQDDIVKPGFYEALKAGATSPSAPGLLYCRHAFIDDQGLEIRLSNPDADQAGCLPDALPRLASALLIQTPSVVVRRIAYEGVGGFRPDLCMTLDWEMWCRIARKFPLWYEPKVLASYRVHSGGETSRFVLAGKDVEDIRKCIGIISSYVDDPRLSSQVKRRALRRHAMFALARAEELLRAGRRDAAWHQLTGALQCEFSPKVIKDALMLLPAFAMAASHSATGPKAA